MTSKLARLIKTNVPRVSESPGDEPKKKPILSGLSALAAFSSNQGYNFAPIKKYDEKHVFFGTKAKEEEKP